jgi:hypothetical protein
MDISPVSDLKIVWDIYSNQYDASDKLWSYFSSVTLAVLGFTIASEKASQSFSRAAIIIFGYLSFCVGNFAALYRSQQRLGEIADYIPNAAAKDGLALELYQPFDIRMISSFYWVVFVVVCGAILFVTWRRRIETEGSMLANDPSNKLASGALPA